MGNQAHPFEKDVDALRRELGRYETYLIPGETLIPGGRGEGGKRFTLVLDMPHIWVCRFRVYGPMMQDKNIHNIRTFV